MSSAAPRRVGDFVVLVGPDGVGKTTLANALIDAHAGSSFYVHFRPSLTSPPSHSPSPTEQPPPKRSESGPAPLGWVRIAASWFVFWVGYLRWLRPALKNRALVVGDRWVYGYISQPAALGFSGPVWLARLACATAPQPCLLVRLSGPAEIVASRKGDLTAQEIELEESRWDTVTQIDITLDAMADPTSNAQRILSALKDAC